MSDFNHSNDHMTLLYLTMGLIEEVDELCHKITSRSSIQSVVSEAGDVLWYIEALKIKLSYVEPLVMVRGDLKHVSMKFFTLIKKSVFFNEFDEKNTMNILSSLSGRLMLMLNNGGYVVDIVTIMESNCLKLNNRYGKNRDTIYINKDVQTEDMLILNYINKQNKTNTYEKN